MTPYLLRNVHKSLHCGQVYPEHGIVCAMHGIGPCFGVLSVDVSHFVDNDFAGQPILRLFSLVINSECSLSMDPKRLN